MGSWIATDTAWRKEPTHLSAPDPAASDAELVAALAQDATALAALYDRHAGLVYGLALKILATPMEAEDLTQEVFLTLARASTYDPARGSLSAYLVTVTRTRAIDRLRARSRSRRLLERWSVDPSTIRASPSPLEHAGARRADRAGPGSTGDAAGGAAPRCSSSRTSEE